MDLMVAGGGFYLVIWYTWFNISGGIACKWWLPGLWTHFEVTIYNILGEVVYKRNLAKGKVRINVENLERGCYLIKLHNENFSNTQKLIIN